MSYTRECPKEELAGCPCTGGTLDKFIQPAILAVLAEGPMHGYGLAERIGDMPGFAGQKPDVSGIYRYLKGMESRKLVLSAWDMSESGPAKKTYQITSQGQRCLERWVRTLAEHRQGITALLNAARRAAKHA
jgi:PadR family transcriptional regulator, regulatory protein PadR